MTILALETSCDETSAAVISNGKIRSNVVATQLIHQKYGGVVPELASRAHQSLVLPVVEQALQKANISKKDLSAIAFTRGPGLLGALLVGSSFSKALALGLGIPLIEVHHMKAHILAHFIEEPAPTFPFLCLTVSGGHTQLVRVNDHLEMDILGQTLDDAVGEAFDKTAKLLGLPYPGGPLIDRYAQGGNATAFGFPLPEVPHYDFSFSGIKTSILHFLQKNTAQNPQFIQENLNDICASVQHSLIQILIKKLKKAVRETGIKEVAIAGGVSANSGLRSELERIGAQNGWTVHVPRFEYCTDNAAMIAMAAHFKLLKGEFTTQKVSPQARLDF